MTEYNVYLIDLATNIRAAAFHVVPTEDDNRNRDELILDYIIEDDNDTGTADS